MKEAIQVVIGVVELNLSGCQELDALTSLLLEGLELLWLDDFWEDLLKLDSFGYYGNGMYGIYTSI